MWREMNEVGVVCLQTFFFNNWKDGQTGRSDTISIGSNTCELTQQNNQPQD